MALILDGSGSVTRDSFLLMKEFCKLYVQHFELSPEAASLGIVQFSSSAREEVQITSTNVTVIHAIENMVQIASGTRMETGIQLAKRMFAEYTDAHPHRETVPKSIIILTDGENQNSDHIPEANLARQEGIEVYAIGVGSGVPTSTINALANHPSSDYAFTASSFSDLHSIMSHLVGSTCVKIAQFDPPAACNRSDTVVSVWGTGFKDTTVHCQFSFSNRDNVTIVGSFQNENLTQCILPHQEVNYQRYGVGNLEVSFNGISFTESDVDFHVGECFNCFGIWSNMKEVCSSRGACTGDDTCSCYTEEEQSARCMDSEMEEKQLCFDSDSLESICGNNGFCVVNSTAMSVTCECDAGFTGTLCTEEVAPSSDPPSNNGPSTQTITAAVTASAAAVIVSSSLCWSWLLCAVCLCCCVGWMLVARRYWKHKRVSVQQVRNGTPSQSFLGVTPGVESGAHYRGENIQSVEIPRKVNMKKKVCVQMREEVLDEVPFLRRKGMQ